MTPTTRYLEWFDAQPMEVRELIAFYATSMLPRGVFRRDDEADADARKQFRARIAEITLGPIADSGLALTLGTITDFVLVGRSTQSDWTEAKRFNARAIEWARQDGEDGFAETIEENLNKMEFRAKVWIRAASTWRPLRDGPLSLLGIHEWVDESLRAKRDPA